MSKRLVSIAGAIGITAALAAAAPADAASAPHHFSNCDAMHRVFSHGVGRTGAHDHTSGTPVRNFTRAPRWYAANTSLDRDHDHVACEAS